MLRTILIVFSALALAACGNIVQSDRAVLSAADGVPDWPLKPGVWAAVGEPGEPDSICVFDGGRPVDRWPACAEPHLIESPSMTDALRLAEFGGHMVMLQVDDDHFVVQLAPETPEDGYAFLRLDRGDLDPAGRARLLGFDALYCGPPPEAGARKADGEPRFLTREPFPGVIPVDDDCRPEGKAGLLAVARANTRHAPPLSRMRWVRDPRPEEIAPLRARDAPAGPVSPPSPNR